MSDIVPGPDHRTPVEAVAERLIGTCVDSVESVCEEVGVNPDDIAEELDNLMFCCDGCGWYCSTDELNNETGEQLCDECNEDN